MGVDYYKSKYVGFKINRNCNDETSDFIRQYVMNGLLFTIEYHNDYLLFANQEVSIDSGRLSQFIYLDRITNEPIYPEKYFKIITKEQFGEKNIKFNEKETKFLEKIKEYEPNFELEYFEVAQISY